MAGDPAAAANSTASLLAALLSTDNAVRQQAEVSHAPGHPPGVTRGPSQRGPRGLQFPACLQPVD